MAEEIFAETSKVVTFYGSKDPNCRVAIDQHFARALSSQTPSPIFTPAVERGGYMSSREPAHVIVTYSRPGSGCKRHLSWPPLQHDYHQAPPMKRMRYPTFPPPPPPLPPPPPPLPPLPQLPLHHYGMPGPFSSTPSLRSSCSVAPPPANSRPLQHPPLHHAWFPPPMEANLPPSPFDKGRTMMFPEFTTPLFHPEVDCFKDIPRLPGETYSEQDFMPLPATEWPMEPVSWSTPPAVGPASAGGAGYLPPPQPGAHMGCARPPPKNVQHVFDDLKMTDQELDNILELKGEL